MLWTASRSITSYLKLIAEYRRGFISAVWVSACLIVLAIIAGMCSPSFEHFWESLVVLNQL